MGAAKAQVKNHMQDRYVSPSLQSTKPKLPKSFELTLSTDQPYLNISFQFSADAVSNNIMIKLFYGYFGVGPKDAFTSVIKGVTVLEVGHKGKCVKTALP
jgi:hypothetical protein